MIDLHTHLDLYPDSLKMLPKVNEMNKFTLAVTTSPRAWQETSKLFSGYNNIEVALGLHPEIVLQKFNELDFLITSIQKTRFIGEIGIDGSPKYSNSLPKQELIFEKILRECEQSGGRIISIHSRSAASKVLSILACYPSAGKSILHWFSGTLKELQKAIEMNCWFSVGPLMIKSKNGRAIVAKIPKGLILPESDGPFTTQNNRPIMPWEAINICDDLSEIWGTSIEKAKDIIENNLNELLSNG